MKVKIKNRNIICSNCGHCRPDKGRAMDGRRAYRCPSCGHQWTYGLQGRKRQYSPQRIGNQFYDTGTIPDRS